MSRSLGNRAQGLEYGKGQGAPTLRAEAWGCGLAGRYHMSMLRASASAPASTASAVNTSVRATMPTQRFLASTMGILCTLYCGDRRSRKGVGQR